MSETLPIIEAYARFDPLVRRTSNARERITITDQGRAVAIFINPAELAELDRTMARLRRNSTGAGPFSCAPQRERPRTPVAGAIR
ncbi:type II toxin-antitoxin system prevent-host-death family antitoxin [Streptomyces sp. NPDC050147]|uniref:type II toxin-antitoxin system prevent-host-death family antitoxin n=1 Tax=Streptomyces sp. NPDC050147 TaxID=3155513 RepID=UPI003417A649